MIHTLYHFGDEQPATNLTNNQIRAALTDPAGTLWVDMEAATEAENQAILHGIFAFHPLTIEDCTGESQRPKVEDFGSYVFIVTHAPAEHMDDGEIDTTEFDMYVGPNYVVTYHLRPVPVLDEHRQVLMRDPRQMAHGADRLAAEVLELVAGDYLTILDEIDNELELLEDLIFHTENDDTVSRLFHVRRQLGELRRLVSPQREVLNRLAWDAYTPIREENRLYFREAYDRLVRVTDLIENLRDLASGGLETYLSVTSNRMNFAMRWMAAVSTLFLPLTFIASFYGMNFDDMPPFGQVSHGPVVGAFMVATFMILAAVALAVFFRMRKWM